MKQPFSGSSNAFEWRKGQPGLYESTKTETTFLPLDDFLQVELLPKQNIRTTVRAFLEDHCGNQNGIVFIASRGKLIAEFISRAEKRCSFGDVVKSVQSALQKSESTLVRKQDPRELARLLCVPAVDPR